MGGRERERERKKKGKGKKGSQKGGEVYIK